MPGRSIATTLFTDIVGSTEKAAALGDRRWREVLRQHHVVVRAQLGRFGGQEIATAGDGFLAVFDNPARAIVCAAAIRDQVQEVGLEVRCGVHMGEVERSDGSVGGIAVHIGARVAAEAGPGEVLVSATVREAERGSDFEFEDRGRHTLKGVPGELRLYALTRVPDDIVEELLLPAPETRPGLRERIGRGKVVRPLAIYLVAAVAIFVLTRVIVHAFDLPGWALPTAGVLLLIGFVVVAATAWVQSQYRTMVKAATGELPRGRAIDLKGLTQAVARGELPHLTWGRAVAGGVFAFALLFGLAGLSS
ncbi:MAG: adenylate/guanylate cyclase domain-containing protein [Gemmatimonadetes bacterium]|nr:adenylate/guanylate cyclase domain-containing protein [Gemmatimonadota bacterium]